MAESDFDLEQKNDNKEYYFGYVYAWIFVYNASVGGTGSTIDCFAFGGSCYGSGKKPGSESMIVGFCGAMFGTLSGTVLGKVIIG